MGRAAKRSIQGSRCTYRRLNLYEPGTGIFSAFTSPERLSLGSPSVRDS